MILCWAINNTQSVPDTAVTGPDVMDGSCTRPEDESVQHWFTHWESNGGAGVGWLSSPQWEMALSNHVFVCENLDIHDVTW